MTNVLHSKLTSLEGRDELRSLNKAAERWDVSIWTVRKWCQEGRVASLKLGARRLIRESEIQRVIKDGLR